MKNNRLLTLAAFVLLGAPAFAQTDRPFDFSDDTSSDFSTTTGKLRTVIRFSFYVMYMIGGLMLAASGFKLKAGDMPGFYKMAAGGVVVFLSPFLIEALVNLGNQGADAASI